MPHLARGMWAALILSGVAACGDASNGVAERPTSAPVRATVDLRIAVDGRDGREGFSRVSGVASDDAGRIFVADGAESVVHVYSEAGDALFDIGREGAGPGEFRNPCCIALAPDGRLWVRDGGNARYSVFTLGDSSTSYSAATRMAHGDVNRAVHTTFEPTAGYLIDVGIALDSATGEPRLTRFVVDGVGAVVSKRVLPEPPADSLATFRVSGEGPSGSKSTYFFYQPFGPQLLRAFSRNGDWAQAVSSNYAVSWSGADGARLHTLRAEFTAPAVSDAEAADAEEQLSRQLAASGVSRDRFPFDVPSTKTPLRSLYFDSRGDLWVELNSSDSTVRRADIFARDGQLLRTVEWPAEVSILRGLAVSPALAYGVQSDSVGFVQVVRLRFPE